MDDLGDGVHSWCGARVCALDSSQASALHQFARRLHQRRLWTVCAFIEKPIAPNRRSVLRAGEPSDQVVEGIWSGDMDSRLLADVSASPSGDENRHHRTFVALAMIPAEITRVRRRLIQIRLAGLELSLQFQHHHARPDQEYNVGTTRLHRQLVFEYRRVVPCGGAGPKDFRDFTLKRRYRLRPRAHLLRRDVGDEGLQAFSNSGCRRVPKGWEVRLPPAASSILRHARASPRSGPCPVSGSLGARPVSRLMSREHGDMPSTPRSA